MGILRLFDSPIGRGVKGVKLPMRPFFGAGECETATLLAEIAAGNCCGLALTAGTTLDSGLGPALAAAAGSIAGIVDAAVALADSACDTPPCQ